MQSRPPPTQMTSRQRTGRKTLAVIWLAATLGLGLLLGVARATEGPLDDPDPAFQRPGFLDVGSLPQPAPTINEVRFFAGHRTVVFFERNERVGDLCRQLSSIGFDADVQLVIALDQAADTKACPVAASVVVDPDLSDAYGLRSPRSGGPPVGYAIVDSEGEIRYRTLDPAVASLLAEVRTILGALT